MVKVKPITRETKEDRSILIWTDGAARGNGSEDSLGAYGFFMSYKGHTKALSVPTRNMTNNQMELKAVIEALKALKNKSIPVIIYSDSAYVVNGITYKWYRGWQANGWRNKKNEPVKNREEWEELVDLYTSVDFINMEKVKGHANNKNNILVDAMLNETMDAVERGEIEV